MIRAALIGIFFWATAWSVLLKAQADDEINFKVGRETRKDPNPNDSIFFSLQDAIRQPLRVKELSLEGAGLKALPRELMLFRNLQVLDASFNPLERLPDSLLIWCKSLTRVRMSGCGWEFIPETLLHPSVKVLDLSENRISEIPATLARCIRLEELDLHANELRRFPSLEVRLPQLRSLVLSANPIQVLPDWITMQESLRLLFLEETKLQSLPDLLCRLQHLKLLNVEENDIKALPACLCGMPKLKVVMVFESGLNDAQLKELNRCNPQLQIR